MKPEAVDIYTDEIVKKQNDYYEKYYNGALSLPNYKEFTRNRLTEEEREYPRIAKLKDISPVWGGRVLIIGTGTGSVLSAFKDAGFDEIYGIEPYEPALDLTKMKVKQLGLTTENFVDDVCESLSFDDDYFDVVYCFTVIEHVRDPQKCLEEMVRVTKRPGGIYITTNDWNYPYEGHYKVLGPTFLGKTIFGLYIKAMGKSTKYLKNDIIFLTPKKMFRFFKDIPDIEVMRIMDFTQARRSKPKRLRGWIKESFLYIFEQIFFIQKNMDFLIVKRSKDKYD